MHGGWSANSKEAWNPSGLLEESLTMTKELAVAAQLIHSIGLLALLALFIGMISRLNVSKPIYSLAVAATFSLGAIASMLSPVNIAPGIIMDGRAIIVGLGAAYGGPLAGLIIAATTAAFRYFGIGGAGAIPGTIGIFAAAALGCAWKHTYANKGRPGIKHLAVGGTVISLQFMAIFTLPFDFALNSLVHYYPLLLVSSVFGAILLGTMVERERRLIDSEISLAEAAKSDPLTGLVNRRQLNKEIEAFRTASKNARYAAVIALDVDHFKRINDQFGHNAGDEALRRVADVLRAHSTPDAIVARMGGEEFCVFVPDMPTDDAQRLASVILSDLRAQLIVADGHSFRVTASAGVSEMTTYDADPDFALIRADRALYHAKRTGRDRVINQEYQTAA
jgi:diguanylate cyclase